MDSLAKEDNIRDLKESLQRLPEDLDKRYDDALERIRRQDSRKLARAEQLLTLISCAIRPLKLEELRQALSIREGDTLLDPEALPKPESLISACCGLVVVVEDDSQMVRLIHYTTEEYFTRKMQRYHNSEAHGYFARILITYLNFSTFAIFSPSRKLEDARNEEAYYKEVFRQRFSEYEAGKAPEFCADNVLVKYAVENWGHHVRKAFKRFKEGSSSSSTNFNFPSSTSDKLWTFKRLLLNFLEKQDNVSCANQVSWYLDSQKKLLLWKYHVIAPTNITGLRMAASFGIQSLVEYYLDHGVEIDSGDSFGVTALHKASEHGHFRVVQMLLDSGAAIALRDQFGCDALLWAVFRNQLSVSRLLLESGSDPRVKTWDGYSAFFFAASDGYERMLELLAEYEADRFRRNQSMRDALIRATERGNEGVVRLLARGEKDWNISKQDLSMAYNTAATCGQVAIMKILFEAGADVNADQGTACPPLHRAVMSDHVNSVALLLESGADIDARNADGDTAMVYCCSRRSSKFESSMPMVQQLLEKGADPAATDSEYNQTSLEWAVVKSDEASVQLLLRYECCSTVRKDLLVYLAKFYRAIREKKSGLIDELLCEKWAQELGSISKLLLIYIPAKRGYERVVRLFLASGAALEAKNHRGETTLHLAARRGHVAMVELLMKKAANINSIDNTGFTPLMVAAGKGWTDVVELFLSRGADINATLKFLSYGCSAVAQAVAQGHIATAKVLLENGADPNARVYQGGPISASPYTGKQNMASSLSQIRSIEN